MAHIEGGNMNTFKIVLTGGPCAGKSKILEKLIKHYSTEENKIFVVQETASEVLASGIKFLEVDDSFNFQDIIFDRQLNKEQTLYRGMEHVPLKETNLVFLDRGLIDNKAYLKSQYQFDMLLEKYDLKELEILENYDLVIDLVSLATTEPELFMKECASNEQRYEDLENAQIVDKKTTDAWLGHRNIKYVYPTDTIEEKTKIVIQYINDLIKYKQKIDTDMYFIEEPIEFLISLNDDNSKKIEVIDYYLKKPEKNIFNLTRILRKRIYKNCETRQMFIVDENGFIDKNKPIDNDWWDCWISTNGIEKEIKRTEYTTNKLGNVCKISCYDGFTTLEIPKTNCKDTSTILNNFNVIEKIKNFEEFYDNKNKKAQKIKKYGSI